MNDQSSDGMFSIDAGLVTTPTNVESAKEDDFTDEENTFYDAGVLYFETDYDEANDLIEYLKTHVKLENGEKPRIELFDIISQDSCSFSQIHTLIQRCFCIIIFLTPAYLKDSSLIYKTNEILINSLGQHSNKWPLMFLANEPIDMPVGMKSICITKMYVNEKLALKKLKNVLQIAQKSRKMKERKLCQEFLRAQSMSTESSVSSAEVNKPVIYNINVNAANVQIGDNTAMYGVSLTSPDPEISDRNQTPSPQIKFPRPSSLLQHVETADGIEYNCDISEDNVQIPVSMMTSTQQEPDSTSDTLK